MTDLTFMEVSLACSDAEETARFFEQVLTAERVLAGTIGGEPYIRLIAGGITLVLRQHPQLDPAPPDPLFRNHLGFKVPDLASAVATARSRGARIVLEPTAGATMARPANDADDADDADDAGEPFVRTTFVAEPLHLDTLPADYAHAVAMIEAPDGLVIELNEVHLPDGVDWY